MKWRKEYLLLYFLLALFILGFILFKYICLFDAVKYKVIITLILFILYFFIIFLIKRNIRINYIILILISITVRILFFDSSLERFSGDANRYIWDGKVQSLKINPYLYPPESKILKPYRDEKIYPNINHKDYKTIYPPVAQLVFYLAYKIKGDSFMPLKFIYLFFEILIIMFLFFLLRHKQYMAIYLLCPLIILESYIGMHVDIIGIAFLLGAFYFFKKEKYYFTVFFLVCSILIKYITLVTVPIFFLFYIKKRASQSYQNRVLFYIEVLKPVLFSIFLIFLFYLPYLSAGKYIFESFFLYNQKWKFNSFIYKILLFFFNQQARIISLILLSIILLFIYFKLKGNLLIKVELSLLCTLLLHNTLFPWYLIWIIPFVVFHPRISLFYFIGIISISYHVFIKYKTIGIWQENYLIVLLQYIPFYILFFYDIIKGSYAKQIQNSSHHTCS